MAATFAAALGSSNLDVFALGFDVATGNYYQLALTILTFVADLVQILLNVIAAVDLLAEILIGTTLFLDAATGFVLSIALTAEAMVFAWAPIIMAVDAGRGCTI